MPELAFTSGFRRRRHTPCCLESLRYDIFARQLPFVFRPWRFRRFWQRAFQAFRRVIADARYVGALHTEAR